VSKIERLRKNFATGMAEGSISSEDWEHEFLPMIEDAERYAWLRDGVVFIPEEEIAAGGIELDELIDAARRNTEESA
jgi:hypothetical protein